MAESGYYGPDPLVCLLGHVQEIRLVVEGVETTVLVDTGSQISALTEGFCTEKGLKILPLRNLLRGILCLEGRRGISIPYKGYVEANLIIPDLPHYNEDVLFLVIANHKYGDGVPVQLGTQVIDQLVATMTEKKLQKVGET